MALWLPQNISLRLICRKMKDKCVVWGGETPYEEHTHIDYRLYYVEGAGQLCEKCFDRIYGKEE